MLQPKTRLNFYSTEHLLDEIDNHKNKIKELAKYSDMELGRMMRMVTSRIRFINVSLIPNNLYDKAEKLCDEIDPEDTEFVALTDHVKGRLWSGDKELRNGLISKNWKKCITTEELYSIIQSA